MNPFLDKVFAIDQFSSKELDVEREDFLKDKTFTEDDVVEWFIKNSNESLVDRLYYVYGFKAINSEIGWYQKPKYGIVGGYLSISFYEKLHKQLNSAGQAIIFSYLPDKVQTDEMLIHYLNNVPKTSSGSIVNFKGDKLKKSTLEWLIDEKISTIKDWKPEWWTPDLRDRAVSKDFLSLAFVPERLLDLKEFKKMLKDYDAKQNFNIAFWKRLPEKFKMDPELFGIWLVLNGGLKANYKYVYTESYFNLEGMKQYFKMLPEQTATKEDWYLLKSEWKPVILKEYLSKVNNRILFDDEVELTDTLIDELLNLPMFSATKRQLIKRLAEIKKLTFQIIKKLNISWRDFDNGDTSENNKLLKNNPDLLDYFVNERRDAQFLANKTNWPKYTSLKKEHLLSIIIALDNNYNKIKTKINKTLDENDYAYVYLEANDWSNTKEIREVIDRLFDEGFGHISKDVKDLIHQLGTDKASRYNSFINASQLFLF